MRKASVWGFLCVLVVVLAGTGFAQQQYGNIRGVVFEEGVGPLPGATVTLHSEKYGSRSAVSSANGIFRFINLFPETYSLRCELDGFTTYVREKLIIRVGINFDLEIVLKPQSLQEEVTVVAESPIVDTKSTATTVNFTYEMLQLIPTARDPYAILQQTPGIHLNSENVGGSEAGDFPVIESKGVWNGENAFYMDGSPITDLAAVGYSPRTYDFDSFDEMQIVTSGADASIQNPGFSINFVSRRGGNNFQGTARMFFTNHSLQSDNRTQELEALDYVGNSIDQLMDYGFQFGGPIIKDKLWFWGGYGMQDIRRLSIDGYLEKVRVSGFNAKLNYQIHPKNRMELAFVSNGKRANDYGADPSRAPTSTVDLWDNGNPFFKLEDEHTFSKNFLVSLKLAYTDQNWGLDPISGMDVHMARDLGTGVWSGSWPQAETWRPDYSAKVDGNLFLENFLKGNHEIKFGFTYRYFLDYQSALVPRGARALYYNGQPYAASITREYYRDSKIDRFSVYLNDSLTIGRLTVNLGLRMDREKGMVNKTSVNANPIAPEIFPAMTFPAIDPDAVFTTFSPRIGLTYDLTGDGKTILRSSVARYGSQMGTWVAGVINPATNAYANYFWTDANGDGLVTADELVGYPNRIIGFYGFDPSDPTALSSPNALAPDLGPRLTDEFLFGLEREFFTDFSLRATLTLRKIYNHIWGLRYDKATGKVFYNTDYIGPISGTITYDGESYDYKYWTLDQYAPAGGYYKNIRTYYCSYSGFELAAVKRFSHRWMMNASLTYQKDADHVGDTYSDPTNIQFWNGGVSSYTPQWMFKISALYQLPWGIKLSCYGNVRQGVVFNRRVRIQTPERAAVGLGSSQDLLFETYGSSRMPTFSNFDISLAKDFRIGSYGKLIFQVDAFNAFNFAHTLDKYNIVNSTRYNEPIQILNPRVIRLGIRYQY